MNLKSTTKTILRPILISICLIAASPVSAQLDQHQQQGLKDTQQLLRSNQQREEYFKNNAQAREADSKAGALGGSPQNKEEMYAISAELIEKIANDTKGDPAKMAEIMAEAQKNPKAFYEKMMSPQQKARVKSLADKIEKDGGTVGPAK